MFKNNLYYMAFIFENLNVFSKSLSIKSLLKSENSIKIEAKITRNIL